MPPRGSFGHYSLVAAGVALLGLLIYVQFSDFLPDKMPMSTMSGAEAVREQHPSCALAKVPSDHAFVAASVLQGGALTNLVIGTSTRVSRIIRVNVDSGSKPVSVFLTGNDVIWEFAGDVERVRRIAVLSRTYGPHAAVVGAAAERVEFLALRDCELVFDAMSPDEAPRTKALAAMFGRRPDHTIYEAKIAKLALPEGTFIPLPAQSPANEFNDLRQLDASQVISAQPVTAPKILPGEAGLMQLAADGSIRQPSAEEVDAFVAGASRPYQSKLSPDFRFPAKFQFAVTREITVPPFLPLMSELRFLVLAGVPAPRGNTGGACIALMDGFRVNDIDRCFGHAYREGIEQLRKMPTPESAARCRLLEPPEGASLEAVSVYEQGKPGRQSLEQVAAALAAARAGKDPAPGPINVHVEKAGDVVLVLSTYNPAIWRVSASPATRIVGVLLISYHTSRVEGIAQGVPVVNVGFRGSAGRPQPVPPCAALQSWLGTAYDGGANALVLDRQVQALTGRGLDGLRGAYKLDEVTVR